MYIEFCLFVNLHKSNRFGQVIQIIQRYMKKNASCRTIRTNITNPMNGYKIMTTKRPQLDLLSCRNQQAPKIQMPGSVKSPFQTGLRKKVFSNIKLPNNENLSQTNIVPTSPSPNTIQESAKAYDQLKNKISNLQGRLVEIKKNFQLSFQKRTDKSKAGKENQSLRQKQKSKLVLTRNQEKVLRDRTNDKENVQAIKRDQRQKQLSTRKKTIQLKGDKADSMLHEYVTTFTCQSPSNSTLLQCTSQTNLFKPNKLVEKRQVKTNRYYISAIINAYSNQKSTSFDQLCKNHLTTSIDILHYTKNFNRPPHPNPKKLPPTKKPTLIFDLDQTLIHCNQHANMPCDVLLPIKFPNGALVNASVNIRPWVKQCLEQLSKQFELIVFTASHQCYANVIIDYIDPKRYISHRYFRDSCWRCEQGFYVKDLRIIDRDLKNVLLIDNAAYSYCLQLDNGVPIVPFYNNKADLELKNLVIYMKNLGSGANLRSKNASIMKLHEYCTIKQPRQLLNKLYQLQG